MSAQPFIELEDVSFAYPGTRRGIFEHLQLTLGPDVHRAALVGKDGSGKSTLMKLLFGLVRPQRGRVRVSGLDADRSAERFLSEVAYMPQDAFLYQELSVMENLRLAHEVRTARHAPPGELEQLLERVDLLRFADYQIQQLSGGMKQKIALLCTIVHQPRILILDEPTVGVDPLSRQELWRIIDGFLDEHSHCIFSTAYLEEAQEAQTCVIIADDGVMAVEVEPLLRRHARLCYTLSAPRYLEAYVALLHQDFERCFTDLSIREGRIHFMLREGVSRGEAEALFAQVLQGQRYTIAPRATTLEDVYLRLLKKEPYGITITHPAAAAAPGAGGDEGGGGAQPGAVQDGGAVIALHGVRKVYGTFTAVEHTSFEVRSHEIFGLLGPNGAGKTTTFRMMCALLDLTEGRIEVNGRDLRQAISQVRAEIGYVSQKFTLYTRLTCRQNIEYFARSYGLHGAVLARRLDELLEIFEVRDYLKVRAGELPFGTQRELSMLVALIHHPRILFLDEATSGADIVARRKLWLILNLLREQGVTVIITTHFLEEAEFCDRFLIQARGQIICLGTPDEICRDARGRRISVHQLFIDKVRELEHAHAASAGAAAPAA